LGKKLVWPWAGELPKIWGFPFNISATTEASDFKFGISGGLAWSIIEEKVPITLVWELPKCGT